ncbi:hypothetical protein TRAPUB_7323 [Trametes pubescens]|uniref:Major facilitator superfamily (MFS) profile domain-containing protein n=1 Tax=Trametes pubescens TaxID=154538 RepID=A0A1M2V3Q1_TRAPU|nr:hypothetical protein TRAPUB_7323 [Trametes pubescens]
MEVPRNDQAHDIEQFELSSMQDDPDAKGTSTPATTYTRSSSRAALHSEDPQEGATVQELPPIDRGIKAWTFCFSAFVLEMMVWQLILLQGVGVGIGGGLLYMPVIQLIPEWFSERRGLAGGIIFAGTGLGGFVFPFVLRVLLDKVGLGWTLRIWALSTSLFSGIALLGMRNRLPVPKFTALNRRPRFIPPHIGFVRNPLFWTFAITNMLQGLSYFPVSLYIATFTRNVANQLTATIVLSLFNSSAVVGQIIMGHLSDRFPYPSIMVFSAVGSALSAFFLWGFADAAIFLYFFAVIFGGLSGGFSSTWPNAAVESVGGQAEYACMSFAGTAFFKGISAVIGPVISGLLLQRGNGASLGGGFGKFGYGAVEIFVGSCALATGAGSVAVAFARRRIQN